MRRNSVVLGILIIVSAMGASAQSFSFYSTLRAGRNGGGSAGGNGWEIATGTTPAYSNATWTDGQFSYNSSPSDNHWRASNGTQQFEVGYDALTNRAVTRVRDFQGDWTEVSRTNPAGAIPSNTIWTLPASSFNVSVASSAGPSSIAIEGLTLSPNVALLSGSLPPSLAASFTPGVGTNASLSSPLVLNAAANGGSWFLSGTIRFSGLQGSGGSALGSQLSFNLGAIGNPTPEASTMSLLGGGLVLLGWMSRRRRMGGVK